MTVDGDAGAELPAVDVITPVLNEAAIIAGKLANLASLAYPGDRLRVIVVDGGSCDGTARVARTWAGRHDLAVEVIESAAAGKAAKIDAGLTRVRASWVLITDADARLPKDALLLLVRRALADARVGLVGTELRPAAGHPLDRAHWAYANGLRRLERRLGCAGLVVGPCYLVRRDLIGGFPADITADDVHVTCRALLSGARIDLVPTTVVELRTPAGAIELAAHKLRRANGYLREIFRSLPAARARLHPPALAYFLRAGLILGSALLFPALLIWALAVKGWVAPLAVAAALLAALASAAAPPGLPGARWLHAAAYLGAPVMTALILTGALLSYPFLRTDPVHRRIKLPADPEEEAARS